MATFTYRPLDTGKYDVYRTADLFRLGTVERLAAGGWHGIYRDGRAVGYGRTRELAADLLSLFDAGLVTRK